MFRPKADPKPDVARQRIEAAIGGDNLTFYLHLYRTMADIELPKEGISFLRGELLKLGITTSMVLKELRKRGYLQAEGYARVRDAWKEWKDMVQVEVDRSSGWQKTLGGCNLYRVQGHKKRFANPPLSVIVYGLANDLKNAGFKAINRPIADLLRSELNLQYEWMDVAYVLKPLTVKSVARILASYYLACDGRELFPADLRNAYSGSLKEIIESTIQNSDLILQK